LIKKSPIPIDGSDDSDKAQSYGLDLAEKYSEEIVLLTGAQRFGRVNEFFFWLC